MMILIIIVTVMSQLTTAELDCGKIHRLEFGPLMAGTRAVSSYPGQWPWLVPLFFTNESSYEQFLCGSSLISHKHLLTGELLNRS
jgi:hypothetical protein